MGYNIELIGSEFFIAKADKEAALEALFDMWVPEREADMSGGSWGYDRNEKWYAWMNGSAEQWRSRTIENLEIGISEWGYNVFNNDNGDIVDIWFDGDKIGDEGQMFNALAPFVRAGSYLDYMGEDGALWRWEFTGNRMVERTGRVVFD
jgi:hypothetical protein